MTGLVTDILGTGDAASRPAIPEVGTAELSFYFANDTKVLSVYDWDAAGWRNIEIGGGDMLGSNNLSDVDDDATSRANLGVPYASTTEVLTGTEASKVVTPDGLASLWEQGANIASAGTISVGEGGFFHVTGTTTITDIDPATDKAGRTFILVFDGALTLTHNASTLILPNAGLNISTAAGDSAVFVSEGSDAVRCVFYQRKTGRPFSGAKAKKTTSLTGLNFTTEAAITFDAEDYDSDAYHDTGSNTDRLTVPIDGGYNLQGFVICNSATGAEWHRLRILRYNSAGVQQGAALGGMTTEITTTATGFFLNAVALGVSASAGDYFKLLYQVEADASIDLGAAEFTIQRVF